ncbi:uncharacterized protein LOC119582880 isoform X2 [Penaeus monodon]|nr:uncharacterized protein LOC119582880 isoform X2 [Penaeus monodon]
MTLFHDEKENYILHVCCKKKKYPYISNKRNANVVKLRNDCFSRIKEIMAQVAIGEAFVTATKTSTWLQLRCMIVNVCLMLHFPVHKNSLVATCPHRFRKKRKLGEVSSSVTYFTASGGVSHLCKKAEIPTEKGLNAGTSYTFIHHDNDEMAKALLRKVDERVKQTVRRNAEVVRVFSERLQTTFPAGGVLAGADVMHSGSAYEGLTVKPKTDFDVIVVLALQCLEAGFEVIRDESSFFRIKARSGFVQAEHLQSLLFKELTECVNKTKVSGTTIRCREGLASLGRRDRNGVRQDLGRFVPTDPSSNMGEVPRSGQPRQPPSLSPALHRRAEQEQISGDVLQPSCSRTP